MLLVGNGWNWLDWTGLVWVGMFCYGLVWVPFLPPSSTPSSPPSTDLFELEEDFMVGWFIVDSVFIRPEPKHDRVSFDES